MSTMSKDQKIKELAGIIDTLCIELKKNNSIATRRMKAKNAKEKARTILGLDKKESRKKEQPATDSSGEGGERE